MDTLCRTSLVVALIGGIAVLASCGGGKSNGPDSTPVPAATSTPAVGNEGDLIVAGSEPVAFAFAPDGRLFFTERTSGELKTIQLRTSSVPLEQQQLPPVLAAKQELAGRADTQPDSIAVVAVTAKDWPDSCLGLGDASETCAQVVIPGYEVVLRAPGNSGAYTYRTDQGTNVRMAGVQPISTEPNVFTTVDVHYGDECGLIGVAIDPEFSTNHYVYAYAVRPVDGRDDVGSPAIIRYTDIDGEGSEPTVLLELPQTNPQSCAHVSGNLHFGPDGFLYVSVGNLEQPDLSAGVSAPIGKILRLNKDDGSAAPGNPFEGQVGADARTFALGFRNPFDFAFDPQNGKIYAPDNGPGNCDELNLIEEGSDYGAPDSLQVSDVPSCLGLGGADPVYLFAGPGETPGTFGSNVAPSGVAVLRGANYPSFGEGLLVCEFVPHQLHMLTLGGANQDQVTNDTQINDDCNFNVEVGPDGLIYYSNRQGIFRIPGQSP